MADKAAKIAGKQRVEVSGHNRETSGRVVHYLRPLSGTAEGGVEFHGGLIVTDDKGIIEDGKQFDLTIECTPVKGS